MTVETRRFPWGTAAPSPRRGPAPVSSRRKASATTRSCAAPRSSAGPSRFSFPPCPSPPARKPRPSRSSEAVLAELRSVGKSISVASFGSIHDARDLERTHHVRTHFDPGRPARRRRIFRTGLLPASSQEGHGPDQVQEVLQRGGHRGRKRRDRQGLRGREEEVRGRGEGGARGGPEERRRRQPVDRRPAVRGPGFSQSSFLREAVLRHAPEGGREGILRAARRAGGGEARGNRPVLPADAPASGGAHPGPGGAGAGGPEVFRGVARPRRARSPRPGQEGGRGEDGAPPDRSDVGRVGPDAAPRRVPPSAGEAARLQTQVRGQDGGARPGRRGQGRGPDGSPSQEHRESRRPGKGEEKPNQESRSRLREQWRLEANETANGIPARLRNRSGPDRRRGGDLALFQARSHRPCSDAPRAGRQTYRRAAQRRRGARAPSAGLPRSLPERGSVRVLIFSWRNSERAFCFGRTATAPPPLESSPPDPGAAEASPRQSYGCRGPR